MPVGKEVKTQITGTMAAPHRHPSPRKGARKNAETQDKCSSTGNSRKHQSMSEGQNQARAQASPLPVHSEKEKRKKCLSVAQPCYGVRPKS